MLRAVRHAMIFAFCAASAALVGAISACEEGPAPPVPTSGSTGAGGGGGAGGACPMGPQAMFELTVTAVDGPVPPDTRIAVSWSAADEPEFALDDPFTWKTLEEANIECDVDPSHPPGPDLPALLCHLWTSGATHVKVTASDYQTFEETFTPTISEHCEGPIPTAITVTLQREPMGEGGSR